MMGISINTTDDLFIIKIDGDFNYTMHESFRDVIKSVKDSKASKYVIDMGGVQSMDSAALGMLLLLRDVCGGGKEVIDVVRCKSELYSLFITAKFDDYFNFK